MYHLLRSFRSQIPIIYQAKSQLGAEINGMHQLFLDNKAHKLNIDVVDAIYSHIDTSCIFLLVISFWRWGRIPGLNPPNDHYIPRPIIMICFPRRYTLSTPHIPPLLYIVLCTLYTATCILYMVPCTVYNIKYNQTVLSSQL